MVVSYSASLGSDFVSGPIALANDNLLCFSGLRISSGTALVDIILKQVRECRVFFCVYINGFSQTKTSLFFNQTHCATGFIKPNLNHEDFIFLVLWSKQ